MRRLLALVGAVAMVVAAVVVRGGDGGGGDPLLPSGDGEQVLALRCATELAAACEALAAEVPSVEVAVEPAGVTADALVAGEAAGFDAWLVPAPWVGVVGALGAPGALGEASPVLARSPLAVAAFDRSAPDCGDAGTSWRCIGDAAAELRPGIDDLDGTAGLFTLAQAGAAFFGTEDYATNDLEVVPEGGGPAFVDWAARLLRAVPRSPFATPLDAVLRTETATFDFAATSEAVATTEIAGTRQEGALRVLYPAPVATVDVVVAPASADGRAPGALVDLVAGDAGRSALRAAGWRVEGEPLPAGADPAVVLPGSDGLPDPGVLAALRSRFG